jgi:hypothetical protein
LTVGEWPCFLSGIPAGRLRPADEFFVRPSELRTPTRAFARYVRDLQLLVALDLPADRTNTLANDRYDQYVRERGGV